MINDDTVISTIYTQVKKNWEAGERTVVCCTSFTVIHELQQLLVKLENPPKVKCYHGKDTLIQESGLTMAQQKVQDFQNIEQHIGTTYDVLLYTNSMTAGISYELEHFDKLIGAYIQQPDGNCIDFYQFS
jgi:hypothetical protein